MGKRKYEVLYDNARHISWFGRVFRIRALIDFGDVKAGDLGGFVKSEKNLSQEGDCWIYDDAMAYNDAQISGDAQLRNNARACEKSQIKGKAKLCDWARASGETQIGGEAWLRDYAWVYDDAIIYDKVEISGQSGIGGNTKLSGNAKIHDQHIHCGIDISKGFGDRITCYAPGEVQRGARVKAYQCTWAYNTELSGKVYDYSSGVYIDIEDLVCRGYIGVFGCEATARYGYKNDLKLFDDAKIRISHYNLPESGTED